MRYGDANNFATSAQATKQTGPTFQQTQMSTTSTVHVENITISGNKTEIYHHAHLTISHT